MGGHLPARDRDRGSGTPAPRTERNALLFKPPELTELTPQTVLQVETGLKGQANITKPVGQARTQTGG